MKATHIVITTVDKAMGKLTYVGERWVRVVSKRGVRLVQLPIKTPMGSLRA